MALDIAATGECSDQLTRVWYGYGTFNVRPGQRPINALVSADTSTHHRASCQFHHTDVVRMLPREMVEATRRLSAYATCVSMLLMRAAVWSVANYSYVRSDS
jgi:hypothetical protein